MRRVAGIATAAAVLLGTAGPWNAVDASTIHHAAVGLQCTQRQDCGFLPGLACINQTCAHCTTDTDCGASPSDLSKRCIVQVSRAASSSPRHPLTSVCIEKNLFSPFTSADAFASFMAFLSAALGSGCGVGGGGLLVPLYILVVGLSPKHAIPLSKATIFGGAAATFLVNFRKSHPLRPKRPLIDYALAAMMEPPTLVGSIFGVMFNRLFPSWLILILLITLLGYTAYRTLQKGKKLYGKEQLALHSDSPPSADDSSSCLINVDKIQIKVDWCARKWLLLTREARHRRQQRADDDADFASLPPLILPPDKDQFFADARAALEADEFNTFPIQNVLPLVVCWCLVFAQAIILGGHGTPSLVGVPCGTVSYWLLTILPLTVLFGITTMMGRRLRLRNRLRVLSQVEFVDGDVHWTRFKTQVVFPAYCIVAGIAAGLLGIGGGMVKGPVMLENGILPPVQSSSASFMILFTSSATTLLFSIAGTFPGQLQYGTI
ncbi:hypothetical protein, variant [Aphanomyces astaci]|uniref:Membrane transporter protein n=1 Tax=Aphanomyces astaci TaxID=112090 RepID=W4G021_APHAT|nr:hypothetical protein, variant [Aphanomyces astaci]ETV72616.1 hypothetical protein, variant [Aphanomyces astaci]|eukprot:XP_009837844.1 hypothetical protein, variant [Aphanomyces astaci]